MTLCETSTLSPSTIDRVTVWSLRAVAAAAASLVVIIVGLLVIESATALRDVAGRLVSDPSWHPAPRASQGAFGIMPMVWGTLAVTVGACALAAPAGVASGVFCRFYAGRRLAAGYRGLIGLLAGIPSVVYGFWGLVVVAPLIAEFQPPGAGLATGVLVVGLMITPTIALVADAALGAVPVEYVQGAAALGMGRGTIVGAVAIPAAAHGLVTGVVLGAARAIGETMAVLMVCGNIVRTPTGLFDPVRTLTANIALEMGYALGDHRSALFVSGLILMAMVCVMFGGVELGRRVSAVYKRG